MKVCLHVHVCVCVCVCVCACVCEEKWVGGCGFGFMGMDV